MGPASKHRTAHGQPDKTQIRLVLLNDQGLFRRSLAHFLQSKAGIEVAGELATAGEALQVLRESAVDIVLLDFDFGPDHAEDFIYAARVGGYKGRFLIIAGAPNKQNAARALKLGASGIFLKTEVPERLVEAIQIIASGGVWVDPEIIHLLADQLLNQHPNAPVANNVPKGREQMVIVAVASGMKNREIAEATGLTQSAVKNTLYELFRKTGAKSRSQLVRWALESSERKKA